MVSCQHMGVIKKCQVIVNGRTVALIEMRPWSTFIGIADFSFFISFVIHINHLSHNLPALVSQPVSHSWDLKWTNNAGVFIRPDPSLFQILEKGQGPYNPKTEIDFQLSFLPEKSVGPTSPTLAGWLLRQLQKMCFPRLTPESEWDYWCGILLLRLQSPKICSVGAGRAQSSTSVPGFNSRWSESCGASG